MEPLSGEKLGHKRRLGRRTSDWLIPVVMWAIALASLLTARHFWLRAVDAENMNVALRQQVQLLERTVPKPGGNPKPQP